MNKFIIKSKQIRANAAKMVSELKSDPIMEVVIREYKEDKSGEQRGWWHTLIGIVANETGYSPAETKELIKRNYLGETTVCIGNITKTVTSSSEALKMADYAKLIDATYKLGAEAGIQLPNPRYNEK